MGPSTNGDSSTNRDATQAGGELVDRGVGNGGAGLVLVSFDSRPDVKMPPQVVFVFAHPQRIALPAAPKP